MDGKLVIMEEGHTKPMTAVQVEKSQDTTLPPHWLQQKPS